MHVEFQIFKDNTFSIHALLTNEKNHRLLNKTKMLVVSVIDILTIAYW